MERAIVEINRNKKIAEVADCLVMIEMTATFIFVTYEWISRKVIIYEDDLGLLFLHFFPARSCRFFPKTKTKKIFQKIPFLRGLAPTFLYLEIEQGISKKYKLLDKHLDN